ncbi:TetR/AcrR family transcriptional regulator [Streptomyces javensis]|uniref:TetR/AcrR family transcriptional regulator n=1 Tax=Streptomyces javensis TaxID=114698 RepID=UPI0033DADA00
MAKVNGTAGDKTNTRVQRSKETILGCTYELLVESGLGGVSLDEVSRRSGVAKTTIYRHWPSRHALLLEACTRMSSPPEVPSTGSLTGDLRILLTNLTTQLRDTGWSAVLPSIVDAAERDEETAQVHAALHHVLMSPFTLVVEQAQNRGELASTVDPTAVVALAAGALFYRRWFSREDLDGEFVDQLLRIIQTSLT